MKVSRYDSGTNAKTLVTGCVTNKMVLASVASKWTKEGLFADKWSNVIVGWCVKYYNRYRKPPGRHVTELFESWCDSRERDDATVKLIDSYLSSLSDNYAKQKKTLSPEFVLDLAGNLFNKVEMKRTTEKVNALLDAGETDKARELLQKSGRIELGVGARIDVFRDKASFDAIFDKNNKPPLVTYPGAAGHFFGRNLDRGKFLAFLAPMKRGKCVGPDTKILLSDGTLRTIKSIVLDNKQVEIMAYNEKTGKIMPFSATEFHNNGTRLCYKLKTRTGRTITATDNHPFLTPSGWVELGDLREGDRIAVPKKLNCFGEDKLSINEAKFLAFMLADGGCTFANDKKDSINASFSKTDSELVRRFKKTCRMLGVAYHRVPGKITYSLSKQARPLLRKFGLAGKKSKHKTVPQEIFSSSKKLIRQFLRTFFSCDGTVYQDSNTKEDVVELTLSSKKMLRQISHLLLRFGVVHSLRNKTVKLDEKEFKVGVLAIRSAEYVQRFFAKIGMLSYKSRTVVPARPSRSFLDTFPPTLTRKFLDELAKEFPDTGLPTHRHKPGWRFKEVFGADLLWSLYDNSDKGQSSMRKSFSHMKGTKTYDKYMNSNVLWDEVVSIQEVGVKETYDITVPEHHNFIANDIVIHNSYFLMDIVWVAMTQGLRVAYFVIGDMTRDEVYERLIPRGVGRPIESSFKTYPGWFDEEGSPKKQVNEVKVPKHIVYGGHEVEWESKTFKKPLSRDKAWNRIQKRIVSGWGDDSLIGLSVHPNYSITMAGISREIEAWTMKEWVPDVVVIDYADALLHPSGYKESRDGVNENWAKMRALSQSLDCLVVTATQGTRASIKARTLEMEHFSEDIRKAGHVSSVVGINQTEEEKVNQTYRLNFPAVRNQRNSVDNFLYVVGCLDISSPIILSTF